MEQESKKLKDIEPRSQKQEIKKVESITSKSQKIKWIIVGIFSIGIIMISVGALVITFKKGSESFPIPSEKSIPETPFKTGTPSEVEPVKEVKVKDVQFVKDIVPVFAKFCDELNNYEVMWTIENPSDNIAKIKLTSQVSQYSQPKIDEVQIDPKTTKIVRQCITFDEFTLKSITEKTKASLQLTAYLGEKTIYNQSVAIWIHAWDDMIWSLNAPMDTSELIAAWVTPRNPAVMEVISKAKEKTSDRSLIGCQFMVDENRMKEELKAIYDTLCFDYRVSYVSTPVSYAPGISQRVSLPSEVIKYKSANCIDGSVLYASLMEALNFEPEIVLIPGHAFVCAYCPSAYARYCIETTLMKDCSSFLFFQFSSFDSAVQEGYQEWYQYFNNLPSCRPNENTCIISVKEARKKGITPLE
ncbi:MAG: hypothetical protein QXO40_03205 [Candidatus Aenigmatarchaeota archaeon]